MTPNMFMARSIVGGLNYLTHTRPDIAILVSVVSRYMHNPTKQHLGSVKRANTLLYSLNSEVWDMVYEST